MYDDGMFGAFLLDLRRSRGLTQAELAAVVGIDQPNLSAYEHDRRTPSAETLHRIVTACGYRLVAEAGERRIALAPPPTPRVASDPHDEPPVVGSADPRVRGEALEQLLRLAEATRGRR
jgi:transcriptional regulator with XRE-family HTH domain